MTKSTGDATAIVSSRHDYLPFGEELARGTGFGGGPTQKFTSKERDAETGLDYFGARYMSSAQGRFTTVDPSLTISLKDPQSWNRYSYVNNRSLTFVDPDGRWPRKIHDQIIARAFPGLPLGHQVRLKDASLWSDTRYMLHSDMHHTRDRGVSRRRAKQDFNNFLNTTIQNARETQQSKVGSSADIDNLTHLSPEALWEFGFALHGAMDSTSPAHVEDDGDPAEYVFSAGPMLDHIKREETITPQQMDRAVQLAQYLFGVTFGQRAAEQATQAPKRRKKDYEVQMIFRPEMEP